MKSRLLGVYRSFYRKKPMVIVLYGLMLALAAHVIIVGIAIFVGYEASDAQVLDNEFQVFILKALVAPFLETLLFQYLPLKVLGRIKKPPYFLIILMASLVFGGMHFSSPIHHMLLAFVIGLYLTFSCFVFIRRKQHPLFYVWLIHACYSGLLVGLSMLLAGMGV